MIVTGPCERYEGFHNTAGRPVYAGEYVYRLRWEEAHGPLPPGVDLHHGCEHAWCINLAHLEPLSHGDHTREHSTGRARPRPTHCQHGHLLDEANTYTYVRDGYVVRACRHCHRDTARRWRERQKGRS